MGVGSLFMFCTPRVVFGGTKGVWSHFHILRARTHFRQYRGRRVPFSCFARPDSISTVPRASGYVFLFCALGLVFGDFEGVGSRFYVLRAKLFFGGTGGVMYRFLIFGARTRFWRGSKVIGSRFHVLHAGFVFGGTEGVMFGFQDLCSRTHFRLCRVRRVPFSCFALSNSFSAIPRASGPDFMFCALRRVLGGAECVGSRFNVLRSWNHFRRYRGRRVPFSYFARPDLFSAVPRLRRVPFSCVARPNSFSTVPRASGLDFKFCVPRLIFDGTEGVGSRFHVLRSRTNFRRYIGR
jgi:hypothetical protein